MDRTVLTLSPPNFLTIGAILLGWIVIYALGCQAWQKLGPGAASNSTANNSGGY